MRTCLPLLELHLKTGISGWILQLPRLSAADSPADAGTTDLRRSATGGWEAVMITVIVNLVQVRQLTAALLGDLFAYAASLVMPSIFKDATLVASVHPFASTFQENLLLDKPRAAKARASINRWVAGLGKSKR